MTSLWILIGLIVSAIGVSTPGAWFSVVGLADLFSGAAKSVMFMAVALEFSKFVLAAYLHQKWNTVNGLFKTYITSSIIILSLITSMGIFGFLSNAYQSASSVLEAENIKLNSLRQQKSQYESEKQRLHRNIEEIPANRVSKRIQLRTEQEPLIASLNSQISQVDLQITSADLKILEVKQKVGPLIYISKAFNIDLDTVVKYLILVFVFVFDPLAICLVIASTATIEERRNPSRRSRSDHPNVVTDDNGEGVVTVEFENDPRVG